MAERLPAPANAADAAAQVEDIYADLRSKRDEGRRWRNLRSFAEHLYREASSVARIHSAGSSEDRRTAEVHEAKVPQYLTEDAARLVREMGLADPPSTVGDLRWLRDRASDLAESATEAAYDERERLKAHVMVAAMAKQEAEFAHLGDGEVRQMRRAG